jgi:protein involved in polysaccharide export with SLBB domain
MMVRYQAVRFVAASIIVLAAAVHPAEPAAQEVRIRVGDRLVLEVPQRSDMGRRLVVNERGEVFIPTIGAIVVQGMTVRDAESTMLGRFQEFYPSIRQIRLSLLGEEARKTVYVHGEVLNPGRYEFDSPPTVWEAIREAGGATARGSLAAVRVVREQGEEQRTSIVNLQQAIDSGDFEGLPELKPGDTVIVPENTAPYQGSGSVRIIGAVTAPAPYLLSDGRYLVDAILAAGGPAGNANLHEVKIIRSVPEGGSMTIKVDFAKYLNEGDPRQNPLVKPNDTISVPRRNNFLLTMFTDPMFLLGLVTAAATVTAVIVR